MPSCSAQRMSIRLLILSNPALVLVLQCFKVELVFTLKPEPEQCMFSGSALQSRIRRTNSLIHIYSNDNNVLLFWFFWLTEENRQSRKKSCAERKNWDGWVKKMCMYNFAYKVSICKSSQDMFRLCHGKMDSIVWLYWPEFIDPCGGRGLTQRLYLTLWPLFSTTSSDKWIY